MRLTTFKRKGMVMTEENTSSAAQSAPATKKSSSKLALIPAGLLVVAAAGYGFFWNKQTTVLLNHTQALLTKMSASKLQEQGYEFKYDGVERAGFPFSAGVKIINPQFRYSGVAFKKLFAETLNKNQSYLAPQEKAAQDALITSWVEAYNVQGNIYVYSNIFSRKAGVDVNGATSGTSQFNNQTLSYGVPQTQSLLSCSATLTTSAAFDMIMSSAAGKAIALPQGKAIEQFGCSFPAFTQYSADGKTELLSSKGAFFSVTNRSTNTDVIDGDLAIKATDVVYSQEIMKHYSQLNFALTGSQGFSQLSNPALLGKQNIDIDITYKGPSKAEDFVSKSAQFTIKFNKFKASNDAYNVDWPLKIEVDNASSSNTINIDSDMRANFTPVYDKMLAEIVTSLPKDPEIQRTEFGAALQDASKRLGGDDKLVQTMLTYIPKFSELGELRFTVKSTAQKKDAGKADVAPSNNVAVDAFNLMLGKYGIQANGKFDVNNIVGSMDVKCVNCDAMIENSMGHMLSVNQFMKKLYPERAGSIFDNSKIIGRLKEFIQQISVADKTAPTTRVITIKDNGSKDLVIGTKTMMEAMMLWVKVFTPESPVNSPEGQKAFNPEVTPDEQPPAGIQE
jgi:hypothetical protein